MPASRLLAAAAVAALAAAVSVLVPGLALAVVAGDALLLAAFLRDWRRARRSPLSARRILPPILVQGQTAPVVVELATTAPALRVALREGLHPSLAESPVRERVEVRAGSTTVWRYALTPRRRGVPEMLALTARVEGPWRLAWSEREVLPPAAVRVYPRVRWEGRAGQLLALAQRRQLGLSPSAQRGFGTEPYGVRRYADGDPPNRIHWKATARHGRLMSREETWEKSAHLVVLLDCGRAMASTDGGRSKLDAALATALALLRFASSRGDRVALVAFSDRVERRVHVRPGARGVAQAYARLFDLEPRLVGSAFDLAARAVGGGGDRSARVLLLTSLVDLAGAELLRNSLVALVRQHRPLLVHLEDPEISRLAYGPPATVLEAYAKASALEIMLGNRRLGAALRHAGIPTVSTSADALTLDTLDLYLSSVADRTAGRLRAGGLRATAAPRQTFAS